jgi:hypothetical protein
MAKFRGFTRCRNCDQQAETSRMKQMKHKTLENVSKRFIDLSHSPIDDARREERTIFSQK